jgi:Na+/H+-translocating membrane pyrophosphatase
MLPYWFSAMTMKSVGKAALRMVEEVRRQFQTISGLMEGTATPDYKRCVAISTSASLTEMIAPGALVMLTPIIVGTFFGTRALAGVLAGALVSGVQMAISMSNTGGAWDNAKKYIEAGRCVSAFIIGYQATHASGLFGFAAPLIGLRATQLSSGAAQSHSSALQLHASFVLLVQSKNASFVCPFFGVFKRNCVKSIVFNVQNTFMD